MKSIIWVGVGHESPVLVPQHALSGRPSIVCPTGAVVRQEPFGAQRLEEVHGQIRARREPRRTLVTQTLGDASGHSVRQGENAERVDRTIRQLRRAVEPQPGGHVGSSGLVLLPWRVAKSSAPLDARPERKRLKRLDPRWRWFSVGAARQRWRHFGGHGVDERRTPARRAEHRNDTGTRLSPLVADRGLDLGGRAAPAQHADLDVERAGSDLAGEHGRTGTQELFWVAYFQAGSPQRQRCHYPALRDCDKAPAMIQLTVIAAAPALFDHHIFLEAAHGTELARYGSPGQAR